MGLSFHWIGLPQVKWDGPFREACIDYDLPAKVSFTYGAA